MDRQQEQEQERESFTIVSTDESFFFYDSVVRRVWIEENKRPVVRVTGSHKHLCLFGATSLEGKQLFRQYDKFNGDTFLEYLKMIHAKFPKCHLFMDKASPHYRSRKVLKYFEENNDTLIPTYTFQPHHQSLWCWRKCGTWPNGTCLFCNIINHLQI